MRNVTNLHQPLTTLSGDPVVELGRMVTVGLMLANTVGSARSGDPVRAMYVAMKLMDSPTDSLELEDADWDIVMQAVNESPLTNIAKSAALKALAGGGAQDAEDAGTPTD